MVHGCPGLGAVRRLRRAAPRAAGAGPAPLRASLAAYGADADWDPGRRRRATAWLPLFPYDVLPELRKRLPALDGVRAPGDLEEAIWPSGV